MTSRQQQGRRVLDLRPGLATEIRGQKIRVFKGKPGSLVMTHETPKFRCRLRLWLESSPQSGPFWAYRPRFWTEWSRFWAELPRFWGEWAGFWAEWARFPRVWAQNGPGFTLKLGVSSHQKGCEPAFAVKNDIDVACYRVLRRGRADRVGTVGTEWEHCKSLSISALACSRRARYSGRR